MTTKLPRIAWSTAEFAEMTGMSEDWVRELCRDGLIPATKFGQLWRIADLYVEQVKSGTAALPERRSA